MNRDSSRRGFLSQSLAGVSAAWVSAHWPAMLSAASHARHTANSNVPAKFEFFSAEQAAEIDAISARIIPTTNTPGAREAGVVFFIDRALATFANDAQKMYADGLSDLQARVQETIPGAQKFSAVTPEQQDEVLKSMDENSPAARGRQSRSSASSFFELVRVHTVMGFLIDPDTDRQGNRDGVGWRAIGRDREHMFQPPFGYYDKDYPGWRPNPTDADKSKS